MDQTLHLHEFFVEGSNPEVSHVLLNITEPSTSDEKAKGYFFAICEINNANTKYIAKMQNVIDEIENSYYEIPDQTEQTAMEIVLDKINQENLSMIQPEIYLHCIVGAIREKDIIFSFYGNPQMVLFYKTKDETYKKIDLVEQNKIIEEGAVHDSEEQNIRPEYGNNKKRNQLFSQIIQGKIGPNDFFFAGTPHITEYFNHDRLQKIITTRPPRQSSEHLQKVLSEIKNDLSFGGIIINLQPGTTRPISLKSSPAKKGGSARSLKNLFNNQQNTANLLSPSFLPRFQDKNNIPNNEENVVSSLSATIVEDKNNDAEITSSHLRARIAKIKKTNGGPRIGGYIKNTTILIWKVLKYTAKLLVAILWFIWKVISALGRNFLLLFFVITNYQNRRRNILAEWTRWWNNLKQNSKNLPFITKILLGFSLIILLIFSIGIVYLGEKQKNQSQALAHANAVRNINLNEDSAESSLVYNNTEASLASLQEAEKSLKELSCISAEEKSTCQKLQDRLNNLFMKARKITLTQPKLLIDWTNLTQNTKLNKIFLLNNKIYSFGTTSANILTYDPLVKESDIITPNVIVKNFNAVSIPKENDYAVLLFDEKNIVQFDPKDNSWKKIDIDYPNQNSKISNISVYNRRLYSLDSQNNQIYRHDPIKTGFSLGKEWTKNNTTNLADSIDLAIDGDVFILNKNGKIFKFTNGSNQSFDTIGLDPKLISADEIWTYNDLNYTYVLDSTGKRIVILDKNGQLKTQIMANEFLYPNSMIIDEQKGTAYILDSNKLYQINLQ